jgi:FkbM family methyltransferase
MSSFGGSATTQVVLRANGIKRPPSLLKKIRTRLKQLPGLGPVLHTVYLQLFRGDGRVMTVAGGPMRGLRFCWYTRTGNPAYLRGDYEMALQSALCRELKAGDVFYDVGANVGFFSLLAAKLVGPAGRVVSFEPHPETARQMRKQFEVNAFGNVIPVVAAVCNEVGTANFTDDYHSSVMLRLGSLPGVEHCRFIRLHTTTLDEECRRLGVIPRVAKIDVEGAERFVLEGARQLLSLHKPTLLMELHTPELSRECRAILDSHGYTFYTLDDEPVRDDQYVRFIKAYADDGSRTRL